MTHPITPPEAILVNTSLGGKQSPPKMLLLEDGRVLYVWTNDAIWDDLPTMQIQARIYNADGTPATGQISLGSLGAVDGFDGYDWDNLDLDLMQDGQVMLSWVRSTVEAGKDAPVFAIVNPTATGLTVTTPRTAIQSNDTTKFESPPVTTVLDNGNVLFVWSKNANLDDTTSMTLQGRIYDPTTGTFTGPEFRVGTQAIDGTDWADVPNLSITQLAGGNVVVTWARSNVETGFNEPVYTILDRNGNSLSATLEIEGSDTEIQHTPWESPAQITALSDGRWMATWVNDGYSDDLRTMTIEARIFNADGTPATGDIRVGNSAVDGSDGFDNANFSITEIGGGRVVIGYAESFVTSGDHSTLPHFTILDAATGATIIADVQIPRAPSHPWAGPPVIQSLGNSGYFVAIFANGDQFSGGATGLNYRIFDKDGQPVTGDIRLTSANSASGLSGYDWFDWDQVDVIFNPTNATFTVGWVGQSDGSKTGVYTSGPIDVSALVGPVVTPDGVVNGTDGDDIMTPGFVDAQGDIIDGSDGLDDVILAGGGNDRVEAGLGDDTVEAGTGDDTVAGGAGADIINGAEGDDSLEGNDGDDVMIGADGQDRLIGGEGNDLLDGGEEDDILSGDAGDDSLSGGAGNDVLQGGAGNDLLSGDEGDDSIEGGIGDDEVSGGEGADLLLLDDGNDLAFGGAGDDLAFAGEGNDSVTAGDGSDFVAGGGGDDVIDARGLIELPDLLFADLAELDPDQNDDRDIVFGDDGDDLILTGDDGDEVFGGAGQDRIESGIDADTVFGDDGNDVIVAGEGFDSVDGGAGDDLIYGGVAPGEPNAFNLPDTIDPAPFNDSDTLSGGAGDDTIFGGDDADLLSGDDGDDWLDGGLDADTLIGGVGSDTLTGGAGADLFVFVAGGDLTVTDFSAEDQLFLTDFFSDLVELVGDFTDDGIINQSVGDFSDNQALSGSITLVGTSDLLLTFDTTGLL